MKIDFENIPDGVVPAVVQDAETGRVLTVGFMNRKALKRTRKDGKVAFFSVSDQKVQPVGDKGNFLKVRGILGDCDGDSVLIKALPKGRVCELGKGTCFGEKNRTDSPLTAVENLIIARKEKPRKSSQTSRLFERGINQIAKKLGEEAVELVIEAKDEDDDLFKAEAADVLYHFLVLLAARDVKLSEVAELMRKQRR